MYIKYSTRRFKIDHLRRIRALKKQYASQDIDRTQEQILVQVVDEGLRIVEQTMTPTAQGRRVSQPRVAPMGIRDEG